jgi:ribosome-associated protein
MRPVCVFTDFFVICHGTNPRQSKAIYDEVYYRMKSEESLTPVSVDGEAQASWIVADYLDVVLHVFTPEARGFYRLEDLWSDVPSETVEAVSV